MSDLKKSDSGVLLNKTQRKYASSVHFETKWNGIIDLIIATTNLEYRLVE